MGLWGGGISRSPTETLWGPVPGGAAGSVFLVQQAQPGCNFAPSSPCLSTGMRAAPGAAPWPPPPQ